MRPPLCPCSWLLPMLLTVAGLSLSNTRMVCSNANMQQGYVLLSTAAQWVLSRRARGAPWTTGLHLPSAAGARLCSVWQPVLLLGCLALLCLQLYRSEQVQRTAWLASRQPPGLGESGTGRQELPGSRAL